ncbi:neuronal pentraxin-2a [Megalops cyprinoides]|uniref:neuronal pentraxin-2a n=1 Tax=Megalops cyprinoides TaxID=118141 RepID=UPI00186532C7|nr:neuronal pentraxin-2a [Megalops cyprinoides]
MFAFGIGLLYFYALSSGRVVRGHDMKGTRFVCSAIPKNVDPSCSVPPNLMQSTSAQEDELKSTVMQLRENVLQQRETIVTQQGTIKELTSKLSRCEAAALDPLRDGKYKSQGSWRQDHSKNTMGDLPRDPGETIDHLGKTMQGLKDRLENLEQQTRTNASGSRMSSELRDLLKNRLADLEKQLLSKVAELEEEKSHLYNETAAHRSRTENTLNQLLERITELEKGSSKFKSPEDFKVSLLLRTNYLYARIKKTLPEMYAFTVCMWLKSSASPGIGTPFSYGVSGQANEIVLIEWGTNPMELLVNDKVAQLPLSVGDGRWHHICITWTTRDGYWEAYQDGEKLGSGENLAPWHPIKPGGVIILGQEQDIVGGRFDATQAFVGELSQFNMWDRVLRQADIEGMANCSSYMPGNVVPWVDSNVEVFGGATKWALEMCEDRLFDS